MAMLMIRLIQAVELNSRNKPKCLKDAGPWDSLVRMIST